MKSPQALWPRSRVVYLPRQVDATSRRKEEGSKCKVDGNPRPGVEGTGRREVEVMVHPSQAVVRPAWEVHQEREVRLDTAVLRPDTAERLLRRALRRTRMLEVRPRRWG
jgi:hypothetical protein